MQFQLVFDFPPKPRYTFDNFIICDGNETAFRFAKMFALEGQIHNLLYIHGPSGSGKTHLLMAAGSALRGTVEGLPYLSFKEANEVYGGEYPVEEVSRLAERFADAPVLLIDDVHFMPEEVRGELWQLFNEFYAAGKKIAVTGDVPPRELVNIDEHLSSRLLWGLAARVDVSDDESRRKIMRKLADDRGIVLPDDVIAYLLLHVRRDIPSLVEALEVIKKASFAFKRKISLKLAREALAEIP